jgi:hypothetical protein
MSELAAPARRALEGAKLTTLKSLSKTTEKQLLSLHGMGPSTIKVIRKWQTAAKLPFKS